MKKQISVILIFVLVFSFITSAALAKVSMDDATITIKQTGDHCTIDSIGMMFRRKAILDGNENWSCITEKSLLEKTGFPPSNDAKYVDTTIGLNMKTVVKVLYRMQKNDYQLNSNVDNIVSDLKSLLDKHSEGVVLYVYEEKKSDKDEFQHAVLLTRYDDKNFYCMDPANGVPSGEINLMSSALADGNHANTSSIRDLLSYSVKVWYITSSSNKSLIVEQTPDEENKPTTDTSKTQKCGDNATYSLDNGILTISGTGDMWDYEWGIFYDENIPEEEFVAKKRSVSTVIIEEGITSIGKLTFFGFYNLKNVTIPSSVKRIGEAAFYGIEGIEEFAYNGSMEEWKTVSIVDVPTCKTSEQILMCIKTNDIKNTEYSSPYKTGEAYQVNVKDKSGKGLATAHIDKNGFLIKLESDYYLNSYIFFQPLFNTVGFVDEKFIGGITSFEYENGKISSVTSSGTISDNDGAHKANVLGQILSYSNTYEFNANNLCTKAEYGNGKDYWEYDESKRLIEYGHIGMAPTYNYSYDSSGKINKCNISGPGSSDEYSYVYSETGNKGNNSDIKILIGNKFLQCSQPPIIIDGRTLVPMRAIFEALGAEVTWDDATKTAMGTKDGKAVSFKIGEKAISIDGIKTPLDVEAQIVNGSTMIPARAVAEAFDCAVNWNGAKKFVVIIQKNQQPYKVVATENTEQKNIRTIDATAEFNEKGLITKIDGGGDYTSWFAPFLANINGNIYVNHIWGYSEGNISMFGKLPTLEFSYDEDGILTKFNNCTYTYENGLCVGATKVNNSDQTDCWEFIYNEELSSCTIKNKYPTTPTDTFTLNEMGLIEKHHFLLAGHKDIERVFEYNDIGLVTKCNGIEFEYGENCKLISASNGQKVVTYQYIYE